MDINLTLVVQMLVFLAFVWFTMTFVWPPLSQAMEERQNKIADGLAAAERGRRELELAQHRAKDELKQAKVVAADVIEKAHQRAAQMIEEAKLQAKEEIGRQAKLAQEALVQEILKAKEGLRLQVADLAVSAAAKILAREVDSNANRSILDALVREI
ncbi:MAG: F0F1 ATP synthase subunit B [Legionellaceae bacterium]|nr:F0F1 ATP synthase subunit B [Legionellaceae bacterium]